MAQLIQAVNTVSAGGFCPDMQQAYFDLELTPPDALWNIRNKCSTFIETTILDPKMNGVPLDNLLKKQWVERLHVQLTNLNAPEVGVLQTILDRDVAAQVYDRFKANLNLEIQVVSDFWLENKWHNMTMCQELFTSHQVTLTPGMTLEAMRQRYFAAIDALMQVAQPFLHQSLLPISQNFSAWLPYTNLKENYIRLTVTLASIAQFVGMVAAKCASSGLFTEEEIQGIQHWKENMISARHRLALQSMIVAKQPNHCVKKNSRLELEVKILNPNYFQLNSDNTALHVAVLNFEQAKMLHHHGEVLHNIRDGCTHITKEVRFIQTEDELTAHVTIVIPDRPAVKDVLKEKYYILFYIPCYGVAAQLGGKSPERVLTGTDNGNAFGIQLWTCSAPFVITTNDNQRRRADFTIFWDLYVNAQNHFDTSVVPTASQICSAFAEYTKKKTQTSWILPEFSLRYLLASILHEPDFNAQMRIARNKLERLGYTRWEWYYDSLSLIKESLREYWDRGLIIGFISRSDAEQALQIAGGFLFRFSESLPGQLVITHNLSGHKPESELLEDFMIRQLPQFVRNINGLLYLYHVKAPGQQIGITNKMDAFPISSPTSPEQGRRDAPYRKLITMTFSQLT